VCSYKLNSLLINLLSIMKKICVLTIVALSAIACCNQVKIEGAWGSLSPCPTKKMQGIVLGEGGVAKAINLKGVCFESWQKEGDLLILTGERIPCPKHLCVDSTATALADTLPSEPIAFTDTFTIQKLTADSLILVAPCEHVFKYARLQCDKEKSCCGYKCCENCDKRDDCEYKGVCCPEKCCKKDFSCKTPCEKRCEYRKTCGKK